MTIGFTTDGIDYKVLRDSLLAPTEGREATPYFDTASLATVGVGFNLTAQDTVVSILNNALGVEDDRIYGLDNNTVEGLSEQIKETAISFVSREIEGRS